MIDATVLITSGASAQSRVQPRIRPVWMSTIALSIPSMLCSVRARGIMAAGIRATCMDYPFFIASSSVSPICASGGAVKMAKGIGYRSFVLLFLFSKS